jgi:hypothetical protein
VETPEQYLQRKVTWGIQRLIDSGVEISMDTLRREIAISDTGLKRHINMVRLVADKLKARVSEKSILHTPTEAENGS